MQAGVQKGIQAGRQEGLQAGEALALQKLLTKRFGALPADTVGKITTASTAQIDAWLDLVLDAPSIDVVFAQPRH
jgi:flagellar biosynthesis/type III secretory pathway protein FliH